MKVQKWSSQTLKLCVRVGPTPPTRGKYGQIGRELERTSPSFIFDIDLTVALPSQGPWLRVNTKPSLIFLFYLSLKAGGAGLGPTDRPHRV